MLSVEDHGIGVPPDRLDELNRLLADPRADEPASTAGLGLYVVARLAGRHGIRVELRARAGGGTSAVVVVPHTLVAGPPEPEGTPGTAADQAGRTRPSAAPHGSARATAPVPATPPDAAPPPAGDRAARGRTAHPAVGRRPRRARARRRPGGGAGRRAARPRAGHRRRAEPDTRPGTPPPGRPSGTAAAGDAAAGDGLPKRMPRASGLSGEPAARGRAHRWTPTRCAASWAASPPACATAVATPRPKRRARSGYRCPRHERRGTTATSNPPRRHAGEHL